MSRVRERYPQKHLECVQSGKTVARIFGGLLTINSAYDLRFFESAENVRNVLARTLGRAPNAGRAKGIAVHIQQGRMFFESAVNVPTEIRPLPLFYGMMAFAKAIIISRTNTAPESLPHSHGLADKTQQTAIVQDLTALITGNGTFQAFNDVICAHGGISFYVGATREKRALPTTSSQDLNNIELSFKEVLSRIPGLEGYFENTFREQANTHQFHLFSHGNRPSYEIRIDLSHTFDDFDSLKTLIENLRAKYPLLVKWNFSRAEKAWGNAILMFDNIRSAQDDMSQQYIRITEDGNTAENTRPPENQLASINDLLDASCSTLSDNDHYLFTPIRNTVISDASLQYIGMFLLGSLVRYRPQIWVHAVSRFANQERPADDHALGLIEQFMFKVQQSFPSLVVKLLTEK